ncbi:hypothetical protein RMCBS344292_08119 [Rhizopus microsporus]|nr:hypothetical protein RMCBS344292_08119 [Rhizopus microsporus]
MKRSKDVEIEEHVDFSTLLQNKQLLQGLQQSGYEKPSPIQLKAIPLGRLGIDLIAQAKSGTGKTVVFGVLAIECVNLSVRQPQVLIVAPTREISVQIRDVIRALGQFIPLQVEAFIGGLSVEADIKKVNHCHIIVGTPGRLLALLQDKKIDLSHLKLWVLDEADKLLTKEFTPQTEKIFSHLPKSIQHIAFSATFTDQLLNDLNAFMNSPQQIRLTEGVPTLDEVRQYYVDIQSSEPTSKLSIYRSKFETVAELLRKTPFYQCMIFVNSMPRSIELAEWLSEMGWKSAHISSGLSQHERLTVMDKMRQFKLRVLVCSDLIARGIDIDRVNLVINLDLPWEVETYLHRVGRTGRYGTSGIAINLVGPEDMPHFEEIKKKGIQVLPLPGNVTYGEYQKELTAEEQAVLKEHESVNIQVKPFRSKRISKERSVETKKAKTREKHKPTLLPTSKDKSRTVKSQSYWQPFIPPDLFF